MAATTIKAHKIRLNPTAEQEEYLRRAAGTRRFCYNWGLAEWNKQYAEFKEAVAACFRAESLSSMFSSERSIRSEKTRGKRMQAKTGLLTYHHEENYRFASERCKAVISLQ